MRNTLIKTLSAWLGASVALSSFGCKKNDEEAQTAGYQQGAQGQYGQPPPGQYGQPPQGQYGQPPPGQYGQPPQGQYGQPPPAGQPQPGAAPTAAPPPAGSAPPGAIPGLPPSGQQAGGNAQTLDPAAGAAAQPILNQLAQSEAPPGARPVGSAIVANFQQGQKVETQLQLQPGKCYTVVAAGLPPVSEVNIQFWP